MGTEPESGALDWLVGESTGASKDTQETSSGPEVDEPGAWVSPARLLLEERAGRNRHPEGCECLRCHPLIHGAYEANPEVEQEVAALARLLPDDHPANRVALELLAAARVRLARAMVALTAADEEGRLEDCLRLSADARGWLVRAERLAEKLGLTPTGRAALGLAEAQTAQAFLGAAVDLGRLPDGDLETLERILERARVPGEQGR